MQTEKIARSLFCPTLYFERQLVFAGRALGTKGKKMYFYKHHIGDYRRDTSHLTLLEHGIYRQLLDLYYMTEKPLDANALRLICARTTIEIEATKQVLSEFFLKEGDVYIHRRCEDEIVQYHEKSDKASASAKARWNKNKDLEDANALNSQSVGNANHKPLTTNHEPQTIKTKNIVKLPEKISGVDSVFDYWKIIMNHPKAILDAKRKRAIQARLKDGYSVEQLHEAINGCKRSDFHQGINDKNTVYDDIELICRTGSNVEKFINVPFNNGSKLSTNGQKTAAALQDWIERAE